MLKVLRTSLTTAALIGCACSNGALAQSASSGSKSIKPPTELTAPLSAEATEQELTETTRAAATAEWRSSFLKGQVVNVYEELERSEADARKVETQLTNLHLSMESYPDIVKMLQSSRVELSIDLAGLEARQKELLKQRESAVPQNQPPLMAKELLIARELVKTSQEEFDLLEAKFKAGQALATELLAAKKEFKLAELRLILAESKAADTSNVHSTELSKLILDRAEKSARLAIVEKLLESTYEAKPLVNSLNYAQVKIKDLHALAGRLSSELGEAELQSKLNQYLRENSSQASVEQK